eukprot:COSAG06_NODE_12888_length_1316_cov_1.458505_1_plen_47_part_10
MLIMLIISLQVITETSTPIGLLRTHDVQTIETTQTHHPYSLTLATTH